MFLINSIWFLELPVEFLLFECLAEFTGGGTTFYLATKCFISDITSQEERTTRFAILDAFTSVGWLIGLPLGTRIKKHFGYITLFATTLGLTIIAFFYTLVFLKDSVHRLTEEQKKGYYKRKAEAEITCGKGVVGKVVKLTLSSFKTVFKRREGKTRTWIIMFIVIFILPTFINAGYDVVGYLFYRLQYNISTETYGDLISAYFVTNIISQIVVVPFLSKTLGVQDTMIIILALIPSIIGFLGEAFLTEVINKTKHNLLRQVWALFVIWTVFYLLYFNIFTTTRSAMSKLVSPCELGRLFSVVAMLESCLGLVTKPVFGLIYRHTLDILPCLWILILVGWMVVALGVAVATHVGITREKRKERGKVPKGDEVN